VDLERLTGVLAEDTLAIYLLHGVIERQRHEVRNYTRKHVEAAEFRTLVAALGERGTPLSIDDALEALAGRRPLPPRSFVVSFDDGFRNNLAVAGPILEELGVPAVFYVTTGFVEDGGASWTDMIEYAVEGADAGSLSLFGERLPLGSRDEKVATLDRIRAEVKTRPEIDPYELAGEVLTAVGPGAFEPDPQLDAKLSWDDVAAMGRHPLFTIGGHSHTHRIMSFLDDAELRREVTTSVRLLSDALGEPLRHYSYPEGLAHCYDERVIGELRAAGIVCSPSAIEGVNRVGADPFHLRRTWVP
jgi:peptidoglycan/xylan/chitin deacetylase (PgdA/CDA1 family)